MSNPAAAPATKRVSERQLAANRRNAAKSTGPRTAAGKAISRNNSVMHGLAARRIVLPGEDPVAYHDIRGDLIRDWQPVGAQEMLLVDQIAQSYWRIRRARTVETALLDLEIRNVKERNNHAAGDDAGALAVAFAKEPEAVFQNFFRYDTRAESAYYRAIEKLRLLQKDRRRGSLKATEKAAAPVSDSGNGFVARKSLAADVIKFAPMSLAIKAACALAVLGCATLLAETRILADVTLIDGTGKPPQPGTWIQITDGRIARISKGEIKADSSAQVTKLSGKYVMPGIINLHGHLGNVKGLVQDAKNYTRQNLEEQLKTYAAYGVTTVVSMGSDNEEAFKVRSEQRGGRPTYTRVYTAGRGFTGKNGYPTSAPGMKGIPYEVEKPDQVKQAVNELSKEKVDLVKIWVDDHFGKETKIPLDLSKAIIDNAHAHRLKVAAHIFYLDDAKNLVDSGLDALAHSVRDKPVDDALIASMKKRGAWQLATTFTREVSAFAFANPPAWLDDPFLRRSAPPEVIKTLKTPGQKAVPSDPRFADGLAVAKKNLKRLVDAGVKYGFGTDTGPPGRFQGYFEHMEMQIMNEAGLTPMQIIQAASRNSAEFLGASKDLGTLETGKWADLIVLDSNPISDIKNTRSIHMVMIAGNEVNRK